MNRHYGAPLLAVVAQSGVVTDTAAAAAAAAAAMENVDKADPPALVGCHLKRVWPQLFFLIM